MLNSKSRRPVLFATILSLFIAIALPSIAFAGQKRGRGQERRYEQRYNERYTNRDYRGGDNRRRDKRKSAKFINGHDARDGRWDKRGPGFNRSLYRLRRDTNSQTSNRNRRRNYIRSDQYQNEGTYYNENYGETNYPQSKTDVLVGILGSILGGQ